MPVDFVVRLNDDGTVTWFGLSLDQAVTQKPDSHAKALETIKGTFPDAVEIKPSTSLSGPSVADQIEAARSHEDLAAVWRINKDQWTAEHSKLAANRKKEFK